MTVELHWTDVNGVATVWTEASGPLHAGLLFRTGRADETLVTAGQTHLIEHLAFSILNNRFSNGFIENLVTGFVTTGSPDDVCVFLQKVCEALPSLPADRLEAEKKILVTEAASRPRDGGGTLMAWRFGAAGHGLRGMPEFGIRGATLEQLHEWSMQRFTRENAVLWLSGPLPAGLRLQLPPGEKQPLPLLTPMLPAFPAWFADDTCGGVAAGAIVPRVSASSIFNIIAPNRLHQRLRIEQAVSYSPWVFYEPLNSDTAHLMLYADSDQGRRAELADAFGEMFEKLKEIADGEVEVARKQYLDFSTGPLAPPLSDLLVHEVQRAAIDWLFGREFESLESLAAEAASITAADVAAFAGELQRTSVFAVPSKATVRPWMGAKAPLSVAEVVEGREAPSMDSPVQRDRLVYGPQGVSLRSPDGSHITVRYSGLAGALHYEDGCLCLIGSDATYLNIEPTLWRNGPSICREILKRVPAHLILEQGARSAEAIPKPRTTAWQRFRSSFS